MLMESPVSHLGDRIRQFREARGLLQRELASASALPIRTIGRIERGEVDMRLSTLNKIAVALGVPIKDLIP